MNPEPFAGADHRVGDQILTKLQPRMRVKMEFRRDLSQGPEKMLELFSEMVAFARGPRQLEDIAYTIWPKARVHWECTLMCFRPDESREDKFVVEVTPV